MEKRKKMSAWNAHSYLSADDLYDIDERFASVLGEGECMVFWTGVSRSLVQQWADQRGLKTLTSAMGPLMDPQNPISRRNRTNRKRWSEYMKGASGRFAEYACRNRRAIVVTNSPPNIYSTREGSTYRHLEEPILKGDLSGRSVISISYVHPNVKGAADFQYQVWPLDQSSSWTEFVQKICDTISNIASFLENRSGTESSHVNGGCRLQIEGLKVTSALESKSEEKETKQERVEEEQRKAQEKKEAKRKRVEEEQRKAQKKKEAKRKDEERGAQETKQDLN